MKVTNLIALSVLATGALFAVEGLSVTESVGFESDYAYRGLPVADSVVVAGIDASYELYNGSLYGSVVSQNANSSPWGFDHEVKSSIGYKMPVYGSYTVDAGLTYDWFTNASENAATDWWRDYTREIYVGVTYAGLYVNPAVYAYYDFDLQAWTLDVSGSYSYDLAQYGIENTTLDLGAHYAYFDAKDLHNTGDNDSWAYYGATADVVYHFSDVASFSVGARYMANTEDGDAGDYLDHNLGASESTVSWGAKVSIGF